MFFPERLDLYIHACRQIELHQRVYGVLGWLKDVDQSFVGANLKGLTRFLVYVGRAQHAIFVLYRRQRNRSRDLGASALGRIDDLSSRLVQDAVVVSLEPYANSVFTNHVYPSKIFAVRPMSIVRSPPLNLFGNWVIW